MRKIYIEQPRRTGKKARTRAAVRLLLSAGYTWANGAWQQPQPRMLTLTVKQCDIDKIKRAFAKEPCAGVRLHQIAEPGQSNGGCKP